jgi:hypothetical protein
VLIGASGAWAKPQVSVTITGDLDEMLPILQQLKAQGLVGSPAAEPMPDPIKLRVHSVTSSETAPEPLQPLPEESLPFTLTEASVAAEGSDTVVLTVKVQDTARVADTVSGTATTLPGVSLDFFDDGSAADTQAGDGIWSAAIPLANLPGGVHVLTINAFDADGNPVGDAGEDGAIESVATDVAFEVPAGN